VQHTNQQPTSKNKLLPQNFGLKEADKNPGNNNQHFDADF
jgi:hypothetical protein